MYVVDVDFVDTYILYIYIKYVLYSKFIAFYIIYIPFFGESVTPSFSPSSAIVFKC
jgi:hypothetical protein